MYGHDFQVEMFLKMSAKRVPENIPKKRGKLIRKPAVSFYSSVLTLAGARFM